MQCQKIIQLTSEVEAAKKVGLELKEKTNECTKLKKANATLEKKLVDKGKELDAFKKVLFL